MAKNKRRNNEAGAGANRLDAEVAEELGTAGGQQQANQAARKANNKKNK